MQQHFETVKRAALQPLPEHRFPNYQEGQGEVHRDGHVEVQKSFYSVPPEYLGLTVWVRFGERIVRVFKQRQEVIATHLRRSPGCKQHEVAAVSQACHTAHRHQAYRLRCLRQLLQRQVQKEALPLLTEHPVISSLFRLSRSNIMRERQQHNIDSRHHREKRAFGHGGNPKKKGGFKPAVSKRGESLVSSLKRWH